MQIIYICLTMVSVCAANIVSFNPSSLSFRHFWDSKNSSPKNLPISDGNVKDTKSDLRYLNDLMGRSSFFGNWYDVQGKSVKGLDNTHGILYMHYESDENWAFGFEVFDGDYMDQKVLTILYDQGTDDPVWDPYHSTLTFKPTLVEYQLGETYGELGSIYTCSLETTVVLSNTKTNSTFVITGNFQSDLDSLGIQFQVLGKDCSIYFKTSALTNVNQLFESQGRQYFYVVLMAGIVQCVICLLLEKSFNEKESLARRVSPWSLLILNAFDLYFLLATAYFFMSYTPVYELAAIPYAFLAFLYEPKLIWKIFQIQGKRLDERRRSRLEIQSYFGMLLLFLCLLISLVIYPNFVYFLAAVYMLPQIKQNFNNSQKHRWNFWVTFGIGFPKAIFTIYTKLDPNNLLRITPDIRVVYFFGGLISTQLLLLLIQMKSPRFGFEAKSQYKIYVSNKSAKSSQELCSICLEKLKASVISSTQSLVKNPKKSKLMILTPCKHEFHLVCLTEWLNSKLECPYCRTELPTIPDQDD